MKLNVGCGDHYAAGWTNLDLDRDLHRQPDLIGDLTHLPSEVVDLERVYCGHVLEHLPLDDVDLALRELHRRARPGAELLVVGPDCVRARRLHAVGVIDAATLEGAVHGAGRWAGDEHLWECHEQALLDLLTAAGWGHVRPVPVAPAPLIGWPVTSFVSWQCAALGTRLP